MSTISIGGLVTGLDTQSIISKLMDVERLPEKIIQAKQTKFKNQIGVYTKIDTALKNLQSVAQGMSTSTEFRGLQSTVTDSSVMTVSASSTASPGSHTVEVTSLARSQRQVSTGYASDAAFNTGSFTIDDGAGTVTSINLAEGSNTLDGIAAAINASGANVSASIVDDGSATPKRLVITGKDIKNYTVDFSGLQTLPASGGAPDPAPTLLGLGDPSYQAGQGATFKLDGISITKDSNTVTDVLQGVTLSLLKEGSTTTFSVTNDTAAITKKIGDLVTAYNSAITLINGQSSYNTDTKKAGVLSGDSTLRTIQSKLQALLTSRVVGATGAYTSMAELGIMSDKKDGTLSVDATKLSAALANHFDDVVNLFTQNTDATASFATNQYGIAQQFNLMIEPLVHAYVGSSANTNGLLQTRIKGLNSSITDIDDQVSRMEDRIAQMQTNLKRQFAAMESMVSTLQTQGSVLNNFLASYQSNR